MSRLTGNDDFSTAAVQILSVRVSQQDWDPRLLDEVVVAAVECQGKLVSSSSKA